MEVKLRSISENQIDILELSGRFDAYEAPPVKEWLGKVTARPPAQVVINLAEVNFIDSSGLAVLVQGLKHCRQKDGDLHLCGFQKPVRVIFELSRMDKAFRVFSSEEEAVAAFNNN